MRRSVNISYCNIKYECYAALHKNKYIIKYFIPNYDECHLPRQGWQVDIGNDGKAVVTIQASELAELIPRPKPGRVPSQTRGNGEHVDASGESSGDLLALVADLRAELQEALAAVNELAIVAATEKATAAELRQALEHERRVSAEQRAELKERRRPWWSRWFLSGAG